MNSTSAMKYNMIFVSLVSLCDSYCYRIFNADTTDVQMSSAILTSDSVKIRCYFIVGSQSKGCHVKLETRKGTITSFNLTRVAENNFVEGNFTVDAETLVNIIVFDWERDGSIGSIPISAEVIKSISTTYGLGIGNNFKSVLSTTYVIIILHQAAMTGIFYCQWCWEFLEE